MVSKRDQHCKKCGTNSQIIILKEWWCYRANCTIYVCIYCYDYWYSENRYRTDMVVAYSEIVKLPNTYLQDLILI